MYVHVGPAGKEESGAGSGHCDSEAGSAAEEGSDP
jgi:hypothetical protein